MFTLVVIDMQRIFNPANYEEVIEGVIKEIEYAKKKNAWIMFVEFNGFGRTKSKILKHTKEYKKKVKVIKKDQNGAFEIISKSKEKGIPIKNLRVCGVYTNDCVSDTVLGLSNKIDSNITVNILACGDDIEFPHGTPNFDGRSNKIKIINKHKVFHLAYISRKERKC